MNTNKIGLFFGSFNPIHIGHMMIANWMVEFAGLHQVWFIISPHNPLKEKTSLLAGNHRLAMATIAVEDDPRFRASNVEFHLPEPSYTIDTLHFLKEKYPDNEFVIIAGQDNLPQFQEWKNYEELLEENEFFIYPRTGVPAGRFDNHPHIHLTEAPMLEISSTFIRQSIREKKDIRHFLPEKVWKYIDEMQFYKNVAHGA
jgi:nicotinate-nucleotide adenylyltransferase